ncbi:MAG: serine/threonine-protein kinase [Betaproteobacteria bacterium]|nr:serine/threonine-protein kinase [Betaproteobacteria bacterium]
MTLERIGKYEIRRLLGEGATSSVHLAWDPFNRREVAIKRIDPAFFKPPHRGRLFRQLLINEASLAGKLKHPHIIQIYDAVVDAKNAYVAMEYVPGGTLEPLAHPGKLAPFDRVIEIIFKCTRALDYAFHNGITHRDIKPANILLSTADGSDIRISDFGAAFQVTGEVTQIANLGSPAYMSPQQVREMQIDHRSDIYSLGVVMYQLLTGRLPFESDNTYSLAYRITSETPPAITQYRPELPESLNVIVRRAMEKDIDRRYQSWAEFSHDLTLAFRNCVIKSDQSTLPETEKFRFLRTLPFFSHFTDAELWETIAFSQWDQFQPSTLILKEGEAGNYFCFLVEGEAQVKRNRALLGVLTPGDCFGEIALFSAGKGVRSASVEAASEVRLITIRGDALERASETCRMHFYQAFLTVLSTRLSLASSRIANLAV